MKFSLYAIAALAVSTTAAARKRKITKKGGSLPDSYEATGPINEQVFPIGDSYGATGPTDGGDVIPIGGRCEKTNANPDPICVIPAGLEHGVCRGGPSNGNVLSCQSGQSGSFCEQTSDCVVQNDLDPPHAVCRGPGNLGVNGFTSSDAKCQR